MLKPKVVIFGSSGHAKVIVDIIESEFCPSEASKGRFVKFLVECVSNAR